MSTLFKLLAKVRKQEPTTGINPGIKQAVANAKDKPRSREKNKQYILLGLIAFLVGGALLYYIEFMRSPTMVMSRRPVQAAPAAPQQTEPAAAIQSTASSARLAAVQPVRSSAAKPAAVHATTGTKKPAGRTQHHAALKPVATQPPFRRAATTVSAAASSSTGLQQAERPGKHPVDNASRDALLLAARETEQRKEYRQSLLLYKKALELDPDNYRILNNIAGINIQTGNYPEGAAAAQSALKIRPDYLPALVNAGIAMARSGKDKEAAAEFARVLAIDPSHRNALYNLALLRERSGAYDDAAALSRKLLDAGDTQGFIGLGRIYEKQNKLNEARQVYHEVLSAPGVSGSVKGVARERLQLLE